MDVETSNEVEEVLVELLIVELDKYTVDSVVDISEVLSTVVVIGELEELVAWSNVKLSKGHHVV